MFSISLFALPQDPQVVSGEMQIHGQQGHLQLTTGHQAIINWKEFSIGQNEYVQFLQPSSTSSVLNRVKGNNPSHLLGQLSANGKIYLINPSGVIFGKDAMIQTADFICSTHDIHDIDFLLGQELLFKGDSSEAIINYGTIQALEGNVLLIGRVIDNLGTLLAPNGKVSLAAGQEILLKPENIPILTICPSLSPDGRISHEGKIEALVAELQAEGQAFARGINVEGSVVALNTVEKNGKIFLKADGIIVSSEASLEASQGSITVETTETPFYNLGVLDASGARGGEILIDSAKLINSGKILAEGFTSEGGEITIHTHGPYIETSQGLLSVNGQQSGGVISVQADTTLFSSGKHLSQGEKGGEISLFSPQLTLVSAEIDVSGSSQGGQIFIGGGAHGENRGLPNAKTTRLSGDTHLFANAKNEGKGGTIVVWSEEKTICYGSVHANGGIGGWIEVSSKGELFCGADLSASGFYGTHGSVLLDPKNIIIDAVTGIYPQYEFIDPNSGGGGGFGLSAGTAVAPLSSGNVVITKINDNAAAAFAGAVYMYNGLTAALISTITGSNINDQVGFDGILVLSNGNYIIKSTTWNNGAAIRAGAVTWANGTTGLSGVVSVTNSLVGSHTNDLIGESAIALSNGNYVTKSFNWANGSATTAGAVSWGNGMGGTVGVVSAANSLVGSQTGDQVGFDGITVLSSNNYIVRSLSWANGAATTAGAVTWGSGTTGVSGVVSAANSLVGSQTGDQVGFDGIIQLSNGNYVVNSPNWANGAATQAGAVTWGSGTTGVSGVVDATNSLVGSQTGDFVGGDSVSLQIGGVIALVGNGNYVVFSPIWANGSDTNIGAATWGNGSAGITGPVSAVNSLVGSQAGDLVGTRGTALTNGNYVVNSQSWANGGVPIAGAATWGNGTTGITGPVTTLNSLVGSNPDQVGIFTTALSNGNYVVNSYVWGGTKGAVTWGNGVTGTTGVVSAANSLVGSPGDTIGVGGVSALVGNGNYVVSSVSWSNNGATSFAGAVTWGNGLGGTVGLVNATNSLVGSHVNDAVGTVMMVLGNGNYVTASTAWANGAATNAGAASWGNGLGGTVGVVSAANSLVGTQAMDNVGQLVELRNHNYVVVSSSWANGAATQAGAVTWGSGTAGVSGAVSVANSLIGSQTGDIVGSSGVTALSNGNYVVKSESWANGGQSAAGAATWGNGATGTSGVISAANSLVGSQGGDQVGLSVTELSNGNYVVVSTNWNGGAGAVTPGSIATGISGVVDTQNSLTGQLGGTGLPTTIPEDTVNNTFIASFFGEGTGKVRAGIFHPNQMTFLRAEAQTMTITPAFLTTTLNTGTAVVLQSNNDLTVSSAISCSPGAGALTLRAGRSALIDADITTGNAPLTVVANDLLSSGVVDAFRDVGNATLGIGNNVTINTGTSSLTLSLLDGAGKTNTGSGNLTIGNNATLQCSGSGIMNVTAQENSIILGNNALLQTVNGNLLLSAGRDITDASPVTMKTTGTGELTLIVDALFPTAPGFGNRKIDLSQAVLSTGGGKLLIYTSQRSLNTAPAVINGVPYVPGPELVDSITEKWGVYYPNSSGIPFTIFYKTGTFPNVVSNAFPQAFHSVITAVEEPFRSWYSDQFFVVDLYAPYLTQKRLRLRLPSLVKIEK